MNRKLLIFQAVIISKLFYGLETLIAAETALHKLDTFQMKGLKQILGVPPTIIDRTNTDESYYLPGPF